MFLCCTSVIGYLSFLHKTELKGALEPPSSSVWLTETVKPGSDIVQNDQSRLKDFFSASSLQWSVTQSNVFAKSLYFAKCCVLNVDV